MRRRAIVTGASSGIGQGIAQYLARHGYDVAITYSNNEPGARSTQAACEAAGARCFVYEVHLERHDTLDTFARDAIAQLGGLDLMMLNAGRDERYTILGVTAEQLHRVLDVNLFGNLLLAGSAAKHMAKSGTGGTILFTTSTRGESAHHDDFIYGAAKAALNRACQSLAIELAPYKIRVNCIAPGYTRVRENRLPDDFKDGDLWHGAPYYRAEHAIPLGRMGEPDENGALAFFLASDEATYITGETIRVDGGLSIYGPSEGYAPASWISPDWLQRQKAALES